jgi:hypothetical protein
MQASNKSAQLQLLLDQRCKEAARTFCYPDGTVTSRWQGQPQRGTALAAARSVRQADEEGSEDAATNKHANITGTPHADKVSSTMLPLPHQGHTITVHAALVLLPSSCTRPCFCQQLTHFPKSAAANKTYVKPGSATSSTPHAHKVSSHQMLCLPHQGSTSSPPAAPMRVPSSCTRPCFCQQLPHFPLQVSSSQHNLLQT